MPISLNLAKDSSSILKRYTRLYFVRLPEGQSIHTIQNEFILCNKSLSAYYWNENDLTVNTEQKTKTKKKRLTLQASIDELEYAYVSNDQTCG